jgi:hypothetical protein
VISDKCHTKIGVVVEIVLVVVIGIVVEGTIVVVVIGVVADTIVILLKCVVVVCVIVESIVELIDFDVRNTDATMKKEKL